MFKGVTFEGTKAKEATLEDGVDLEQDKSTFPTDANECDKTSNLKYKVNCEVDGQMKDDIIVPFCA